MNDFFFIFYVEIEQLHLIITINNRQRKKIFFTFSDLNH